ncbi:isochorismatase family protein [Flavobacterium pectinovorum]|uniref:Isochorismatase family protein n=1 Tax=Flavobacterium pectinovorum TaxID=29533 RepID=A0A502F740_9FLAO|nr:isochorismatase family protein [Flavobacterium pectinovorum]TPG45220.1 isochorismatase family protein [Flavobacterium pectinovorum]
MKILPSNSTLIVIDVQERLLPKIHESEEILKNVIWAIDLARTIGIPIILTEHCPHKIGTTPDIIRDKFEETDIVTKTYFSAVREGNLLENIQKGRKQIIIAGTEAHICVQQTVLDLLELDYEVFILDSAVGTRNPIDKERALNRMQHNGAEIITRDMLAFEWLEKAETELFKIVLNRFIKND